MEAKLISGSAPHDGRYSLEPTGTEVSSAVAWAEWASPTSANLGLAGSLLSP